MYAKYTLLFPAQVAAINDMHRGWELMLAC